MTLLAGALIGAGRPALAVAVPVAAAVLGGDHLAYLSGAAIIEAAARLRCGRWLADPPPDTGRRLRCVT